MDKYCSGYCTGQSNNSEKVKPPTAGKAVDQHGGHLGRHTSLDRRELFFTAAAKDCKML